MRLRLVSKSESCVNRSANRSFDLITGMARLVVIEELAGEVVDQLADLPLLPGVFALIEVDGVLGLIEHLPDGPGTAVDGLDRIVGVVAHART